MSFDDVLRKHTGESGRYQVLVILAICIILVPDAFNTTELIFTTITPDFWPQGLNTSSLNASDTNRCDCRVEINGTIQEQACTNWDYDDSVLKSTVVTQFNLVCNRAWMIATASSVYFVGFMAVFPLGMVSDRFGRRPCFIATTVLAILARLAQSFSPNILGYIASRFFVGTAHVGKYTAGFVLASELVGPRYRIRVGTAIAWTYCIGCLLIVGVAYGIRWRFYLELFPTIFDVCCLPLLWFIPESPRWLYSRQRFQEANKILQTMARINRREFPAHADEDDLATKLALSEDKETFIEQNPQTPSIGSVLKRAISSTTMVFRTLAIAFNWMTISLTYYALTLNAGSLAGDLFLNTFFLSLTEAVGYTAILFTLSTPLGRAGSLSLFMLLSGAFVLATAPLAVGTPATVLSLLGKLCITYAFGAVYIYTVELFPTTIRNVGVGLSSFCARIGGAMAPFIASVGFSGVVLIGVMAFISGCFLLFLPETRGTKLPQDIQEAEDMEGLLMSKCKRRRGNDIHKGENISNGKLESIA